jgi:hypothetical protein
LAFAGPAFGLRVTVGQKKEFAVGPFLGGQDQNSALLLNSRKVIEIGSLPIPITILLAFGVDNRDSFSESFHERLAPGAVNRSILGLTGFDQFGQRWIARGIIINRDYVDGEQGNASG